MKKILILTLCTLIGIASCGGHKKNGSETEIRSTTDSTIQSSVSQALLELLTDVPELEGGTAVVMDVKTGAVKAMSNFKRMPDGTFSDSYNYATQCALEPGSVMELATLLVMLEDGYVSLDTPVSGQNGHWQYKQTTFSDPKDGGYGEMTVRTAFENSSNVAFSQLAVKYYEKQPEKYLERIRSMKLGEKLHLEIGEDAPSTFHSPGDGIWTDVTLPMMAVGYGMLVTPMHILTLYNAVANDGKMMKPYFVEAHCKNGKDIKTFQPKVIHPCICSEATIADAETALRSVVTGGTGQVCNDSILHISGKTGTAQVAYQEGSKWVYRDSEGRKKHSASFAGYFPSEGPKYSCIVVLYSAKTNKDFDGVEYAAETFKQMALEICF